MNRAEYEKRMKNQRYKDLKVTTCKEKKEYVFISYRGDSWEKVLTEIVYKLQNKYGLRIYFDKEFASNSNIWIEQFMENMESKYCKAFLCFFDEGYVTSYATLLEFMCAMGKRSNLSNSIYAINFDIGWEKLEEMDDDTGLGKPDNDNPGWKEEKETFDDLFDMLKEKDEYKEIKYLYGNSISRGKLRKNDCKNIMKILQPKNKRDFIDADEFYEHLIVNPLKKTCPEVFEKSTNENSIKKIDNKNNTESEEVIQTVKPISETVTQAETASYTDKVEVSKALEKSSQSTMRNSNAIITETTTLAEFEKLCESVDFCQKLRTARKQKHGAGQIFDFLVASLLGGCDKKIPDDKNTSVRKGAFNYCVYAISEVVDLENVKLGASQYTWMSNARKAMRKEDMPDNFFNDKGKVKSGTLGEYSTIFEQLSSDMTIGEVLDKYKAKERGFHTKNNEGIFEAWELIKNIDVKEGKKGLEELM